MGHRAVVRAAAGPGRRVRDRPVLPATEARDPRFESLDAWPLATRVRALWEGQLAAIAAVGPALPALAAAAADAAARLSVGTGRLIYTGAGSSARLGAGDGAELGPTFDWPDERLLLLPAGGDGALRHAVENAEDDTDAADRLIDHHAVGAADVLIGVAASGATPFTLAALIAARRAGALTVAISNSPNAPMLLAADRPVLLATGAEPIAGSTRLGAGTAQKAALNLLSTAIMTELGRVHGGLMVDMRPRNAKLRRRAERMVAELAGIDAERAASLLAAAAGEIKRAVMMANGRSAEEAAATLARHGGRLRSALAEPIRRP